MIAAINAYNAAFEDAIVHPDAGTHRFSGLATDSLIARIDQALNEYASQAADGGGEVENRIIAVRVEGETAEP